MHKESSDSSWSACNTSLIPRRLSFTAIGGLLITTPAIAAEPSQPTKSACVASYENSQVLRRHGELLEAREALMSCSRQECPSIVRIDCATWLEEVERALPSLMVQATVDGVETTDITVYIDGKVATTRLDGKAISTDPGVHKLRYQTAGFAPIEATVVTREGEHYRVLSVAFTSHRSPAAPRLTSRPIPRMVWILGGAAVVATASFVGWAVIGTQRKQQLQTQCAPFCVASDVDAVRNQYLAADVSLGVAAVSLGLASVLYLARPEIPLRVGIGAPASSSLAFHLAGQF